MICFEARVNGKVLCTAGVGELGSLSAIFTWVKRDSKDCPKDFDATEWSREDLNLSVFGSIGHGEQGLEFLEWISRQDLCVGDEITIKILDQPSCDPPAAKRIETSAFVDEQKRQYFEELKKEFAGIGKGEDEQ